MRDSRMPLEYFNYFIEDQKTTIRLQESELLTNERDPHNSSWQCILYNKIVLLTAYYSAGYELKKIKDEYIKLIPDFFNHWTGSVYNIVKPMLVFGILFDVDQEKFEMLRDGAKKLKIGRSTEDWLINYYLHSRFPEISYETCRFIFPKSHQDYRDIVSSESPKDELYRFAKSKWYLKQRGEPWWGSHKRANGHTPVYFGYWCFEVAAVAKILGIDDTEFQNIVYYPYDLAHFSEGEKE